MQRKILLHRILRSASPVHAERQDQTAKRTALVEAMAHNIRNGKDFACVSLFQAVRLPPRSRKIFRLASTMDSGFYAIIFSVQASPAACLDVDGMIFPDNRIVVAAHSSSMLRRPGAKLRQEAQAYEPQACKAQNLDTIFCACNGNKPRSLTRPCSVSCCKSPSSTPCRH